MSFDQYIKRALQSVKSGDMVGCQRSLRHAVSFARDNYDRTDRRRLMACSLLGQTYFHIADFNQAEKYLQLSLAGPASQDDLCHPQWVMDQFCLAQIKEDQGASQEARRLYEELLTSLAAAAAGDQTGAAVEQLQAIIGRLEAEKGGNGRPAGKAGGHMSEARKPTSTESKSPSTRSAGADSRAKTQTSHEEKTVEVAKPKAAAAAAAGASPPPPPPEPEAVAPPPEPEAVAPPPEPETVAPPPEPETVAQLPEPEPPAPPVDAIAPQPEAETDLCDTWEPAVAEAPAVDLSALDTRTREVAKPAGLIAAKAAAAGSPYNSEDDGQGRRQYGQGQLPAAELWQRRLEAGLGILKHEEPDTDHLVAAYLNLETALKLSQLAFEATDIRVARTMKALGEASRALKLYDQAQQLLDEARQISFATDPVCWREVMFETVLLALERECYAEAETVYATVVSVLDEPERLSDVYQQVTSDLTKARKTAERMAAALSFSDQALTAEQDEQWHKAERLYNSAFTQVKQVLSPDHPEIGRLLAARARMLRHCGNDDQAQELEGRAVRISNSIETKKNKWLSVTGQLPRPARKQ